MRRAAALVALGIALSACTPATPEEATAPPPPPAVDTQREAVGEARRQGALALEEERVVQDGWAGRAVIVRSDGTARLRVLAAEAGVHHLDALVAQAGAPASPFAAIDGGFYRPNGSPVGLVRVGGREVAPLTDDGGSGVLYGEGVRAAIVAREAFGAEGGDAPHALQSVDRLVDEGRSLVRAAGGRRAARSAFALTGEGHPVLVVAFDEAAVAEVSADGVALNGRSAMTGPTLAQFAALLVELGAAAALNLDGGISTGLLVKGEAFSYRVRAFRGTVNAVVLEGG